MDVEEDSRISHDNTIVKSTSLEQFRTSFLMCTCWTNTGHVVLPKAHRLTLHSRCTGMLLDHA
jgi:hypothetical protein